MALAAVGVAGAALAEAAVVCAVAAVRRRSRSPVIPVVPAIEDVTDELDGASTPQFGADGAPLGSGAQPSAPVVEVEWYDQARDPTFRTPIDPRSMSTYENPHRFHVPMPVAHPRLCHTHACTESARQVGATGVTPPSIYREILENSGLDAAQALYAMRAGQELQPDDPRAQFSVARVVAPYGLNPAPALPAGAAVPGLTEVPVVPSVGRLASVADAAPQQLAIQAPQAEARIAAAQQSQPQPTSVGAGPPTPRTHRVQFEAKQAAERTAAQSMPQCPARVEVPQPPPRSSWEAQPPALAPQAPQPPPRSSWEAQPTALAPQAPQPPQRSSWEAQPTAPWEAQPSAAAWDPQQPQRYSWEAQVPQATHSAVPEVPAFFAEVPVVPVVPAAASSDSDDESPERAISFGDPTAIKRTMARSMDKVLEMLTDGAEDASPLPRGARDQIKDLAWVFLGFDKRRGPQSQSRGRGLA